MMNSRSNWVNLKNFILLLISLAILVVIIFVLIVYVYFDHSKVDDEDAVIGFIKDASDIENITRLDYFTDEETYDIVYGTDANDQSYIAMNPSGNEDEEKLTVIKQDDVISKDRIEEDWQSNCDGCTLKKSGPAIIDEEALWELTYLDQEEKYIMEYISLEDGSTYEKFRLNKKH